jgi:signal transduction histidine kinase
LRLLPESLFGRLVLLMVGGLVLAQLLGAALHLAERQRTIGTTVGYEFAQRVAAVYRAIDSQRGAERHKLARLLSTPRQHLLVATTAPPADAGDRGSPEFLSRLHEVLGPAIEVRPLATPHVGAFSFDVYLRLSDGEWLQIQGSAPKDIFAWPAHLFVNLGVMLAAVIVLIWFAARMTVRPLTRLAAAANELGADLQRPPLAEDGPTEVRRATRAFNAMQSQIRAGIEERERFLAAVSHDLKTPVTRLRLRSEMLGDGGLRERFQRDLDDMQDLLSGALDFLRGKAVEEAIGPIDMAALVESLVEDRADLGQAVSLSAPASLRIDGRPLALRRAIGNLVDNALKFGNRADIAITHDQATGIVRIVVDDAGPGLPEGELEQVFEPFYRLESSRSRETGGAGLGLAIVRQIARSHGGDVTLENRTGGGLRAILKLPASRPV